jgi:hypothetical protein
VPQRVRSRPPVCNTIPSPNKWSGIDVQYANQEHLAKDGQCHREGLEEQITRGALGLLNSLQNTDRYNTALASLWQDLPFAN